MNTNKLEKIRTLKKITIDELVSQIGITKNTYFNLRKSGDFRISHLEKIAQIFNVNICVFFNDEENSDYQQKGDCKELRKEISYLKELLRDKEKIIALLEKERG